MIAALLLACQDEPSPEERWQYLAELKTPTAEQCDEQFHLMYTSTLEPFAKSLCETSNNASCLRLGCDYMAYQSPTVAGRMIEENRPKNQLDLQRKQSLLRGLMHNEQHWNKWLIGTLPQKRGNWLGAAIAELDCQKGGRSLAFELDYFCKRSDERSAKILVQLALKTAPARAEHTALLHLATRMHSPSVVPYLVQTISNPELDAYQQRSASVVLSILEADGFQLSDTENANISERCEQHPLPELTSFCQLRMSTPQSE